MSINKEFNIPSNTGDYRILDKKIKNILTSMRERTRFLRGLISYIGFKQTGIFFDRPIRKKGKSKSTVSFLIKYGMDALLSSTGAPVSIITKIGIFSLFSISILILIVIIIKIFFNPPLGFSLTALFILLLFLLFLSSKKHFAGRQLTFIIIHFNAYSLDPQ